MSDAEEDIQIIDFSKEKTKKVKKVKKDKVSKIGKFIIQTCSRFWALNSSF